MAALAVAVPTASASAAPAVRTAHIGARLVPGSLPCQILINQIRFAVLVKNTAWANVVSNAFVYSGCGGAAI